MCQHKESTDPSSACRRTRAAEWSRGGRAGGSQTVLERGGGGGRKINFEAFEMQKQKCPHPQCLAGGLLWQYVARKRVGAARSEAEVG